MEPRPIRMPDELWDAIEEDASDAESSEVWWSTTVQPVLRVAARWGLIVVHDDEFEWIGPPEISA